MVALRTSATVTGGPVNSAPSFGFRPKGEPLETPGKPCGDIGPLLEVEESQIIIVAYIGGQLGTELRIPGMQVCLAGSNTC